MLETFCFLLLALIVSIGFGCMARRMMRSDEDADARSRVELA